jgi:hypothetical protein
MNQAQLLSLIIPKWQITAFNSGFIPDKMN